MKKICRLLLVFLLGISIVACASNDEDVGKKDKVFKDDSTIKVIDAAGRELTFKQPANKVVSGYYVTTYTCLALGVEDKLVGIEKKAETRPIYSMVDEQLLELEQVGSLKEMNIEAIVALQPDVVFFPIKLKEQAEVLEEMGVQVVLVNPETHEGLMEMITLVGKVCGSDDQAKELTTYYSEKMKMVENLSSDKKKTVYMGSNSTFLETAVGTMYQNELITSANGENVAKDIEGDYWTAISYETLATMNPDVIILPVGAQYSVDSILNDPQLSELTAIKTKSVYAMPNGLEEWDSPVPSGILGTLWLASILHEDEYSFTTFQNDVKEFYKTFYNIDINVDQITK